MMIWRKVDPASPPLGQSTRTADPAVQGAEQAEGQ